MKRLRNIYRRLWPYTYHAPSRTVRYAFPLIFVSGVFLLSNVLTSQAPQVLLQVSDDQVVVGEIAYLEVAVDTRTSVNAATIIIEAPPDRVLLDSIEVSDSVITLWTEEPRVVDNTIILRGGTFRRGFIGKHTIAKIAFTPATSGSFVFTASDIELVAGDGEGTILTPNASDVQSDTVYAFMNNDERMSARNPSIEDAIRTQLNIGDRPIGLRDISRFMSAWTTRNSLYDFDGDGDMTFRDFGILLAYSFQF